MRRDLLFTLLFALVIVLPLAGTRLPAAVAPSVAKAQAVTSPPVLPNLGCTAEPSLKSINGDTPVNLVFANGTTGDIVIYWLNYQGHRVYYAELHTGESYTQETYLTHPWVVVDSFGNCLGVFLPQGSISEALVGSAENLNPDSLLEAEFSGYWNSWGPSQDAVQQQGLKGEPVNVVFGNLVDSHTDLAMPGLGIPVAITRTYNSILPADGPLGYGWTLNWSVHLDLSKPGQVSVTREDGLVSTFLAQPDGSYQAPANVPGSLARNPDGTWTYSHRGHVTYVFTNSGRLSRVVDGNGNADTLSYANNQWSALTDAAGRSWTVAYDARGHITAISDPSGRTVRYGYDDSGNLASVTDAAGATSAMNYDAHHRLVRLIDGNGHLVFGNTYDGLGRITQQFDSRGTHKFGYTGQHTRTYTDPAGNTTTFQLDPSYRIVQTTDALGQSWSVGYNSNGLANSVTDPLGHVTGYTYDARGNITSITDPLGNVTKLSWDGQDDLLSRTDALGHTATISYDAAGKPTSITDALGDTTRFAYDAHGLLTGATDALGHTRSVSHDGSGYIASITDALGAVTRLSHDTAGNLTGLTDPLGHTTSFAYDANDRVVKMIRADGGATSYAYDAVGNVTSITGALGHATTYAYNPANDLASITDPLGHTTSFGYDPLGRAISTTLADGTVWKKTLDAVGRVVALTSPTGSTIHAAYDAAGNPISVTDPAGSTTAFGYDADNHLVTVTDALGAVTRYSYDAAGNVTSMTDPLGHTTTYTHDALNRLVTRTNALGHGTHVTYDAAGRITGVTNGAGQTIALGYDAANRLISQSGPGISATFAYDAAGRRISRTDGVGTTTYTYDAANRVTQIAGPRSTLSYQYDLDGSVTGITEPGGTITRSYDALDRLTGVNFGPGQATYDYDTVGRVSAIHFGNGVSTALSYDQDGRLTALDTTGPGGSLQHIGYTLDARGLNTAESGTGFQANYRYDQLNRLTGASLQVTPDGGTTQSHTDAYTYDAAGNRLTATQDGVTTAYTYDAANRILTAGGQTFTYDGADRLTSDGATTYSYNAAGQITGLTGPVTASFSYDGDGNLVRQTSGGLTASYVLDPLTLTAPRIDAVSSGGAATRSVHLIDAAKKAKCKKGYKLVKGKCKKVKAKPKPTPTPTATPSPTATPTATPTPTATESVADRYVYGLGRIARLSSGKVQYESTDALGSVRLITDAQGNVAGRSAYDPFGKQLTGSGPFGFDGAPQGPNGLVLLPARAYSPALGGFLSPDPMPPSIYLPQSFNPYPFALSDPTNLTDPQGLTPNTANDERAALEAAAEVDWVLKQSALDEQSEAAEEVDWILEQSAEDGGDLAAAGSPAPKSDQLPPVRETSPDFGLPPLSPAEVKALQQNLIKELTTPPPGGQSPGVDLIDQTALLAATNTQPGQSGNAGQILRDLQGAVQADLQKVQSQPGAGEVFDKRTLREILAPAAAERPNGTMLPAAPPPSAPPVPDMDVTAQLPVPVPATG